jgi:hypothetical protein
MTVEFKELAQIAAQSTAKSPSRSLADVLRLAKLAETGVAGGLRELTIAELGRVGGGNNMPTTD